MGQSPSSETPKPELRIVDPPKPELRIVDPPKPDVRVVDSPKLDFRVVDPHTLPPSGLALIAHGRNAAIECPVVAALATCLREKHGCRTVTWSARGFGNSEGTKGSDGRNREDYNKILEMAMDGFTREFPEVTDCRLFICGHDYGAAYAGTIRPPPSPHFDRKTRYILISYSALSVDYALRGRGHHYHALESLVQGGGLAGEEPRAEVLAFTGREYIDGVRTLCSLWVETQMGKIAGDNLKMDIVEGADRDWSGYYEKIADVTDKWLLQQPRNEVRPPSESASTATSDQTPSVPASPPGVRGRTERFSGQIL